MNDADFTRQRFPWFGRPTVAKLISVAVMIGVGFVPWYFSDGALPFSIALWLMASLGLVDGVTELDIVAKEITRTVRLFYFLPVWKKSHPLRAGGALRLTFAPAWKDSYGNWQLLEFTTLDLEFGARDRLQLAQSSGSTGDFDPHLLTVAKDLAAKLGVPLRMEVRYAPHAVEYRDNTKREGADPSVIRTDLPLASVADIPLEARESEAHRLKRLELRRKLSVDAAYGRHRGILWFTAIGNGIVLFILAANLLLAARGVDAFHTFDSTQGVVISIGPEIPVGGAAPRPQPSAADRNQVLYEYQVAGRRYRQTRVLLFDHPRFGGLALGGPMGGPLIDPDQRGSVVTVHYARDNPQLAYLDAGWQVVPAVIVEALPGFLFFNAICAAAWLLYRAVWASRKK